MSASVLSASEVRGSSEERRCRDVNDEARDRKEGGGDSGMAFSVWGDVGISS